MIYKQPLFLRVKVHHINVYCTPICIIHIDIIRLRSVSEHPFNPFWGL